MVEQMVEMKVSQLAAWTAAWWAEKMVVLTDLCLVDWKVEHWVGQMVVKKVLRLAVRMAWKLVE